MIVNISTRKPFRWIKLFIVLFTNFYHDVFYRRFINRLFHDSNQLNKYFRHKYPNLKQDHQGNTLCVTCHLCQDICPSKSIELKEAKLMNFPSSLKSGEAPLHFYLNVDTCTKCHLCADVCTVNALELSADYRDQKVDLVTVKEVEKAPVL